MDRPPPVESLPAGRRLRSEYTVFAARGLLVLAMVGAAYLASISLSGGAVAGCGPASGCNSVLSSRWAYWLGIPVSLPAIAAYAGLFAASFGGWSGMGRGRGCRAATIGVIALASLIIACAVWFSVVQYAVIGHWCRFCLATHSAAVVASALLLRKARMGGKETQSPSVPGGGRSLSQDEPAVNVRSPSEARPALALALAGFAFLIVGQFTVEPPLYAMTRFAGAPSSQFVLYGGHFALDPSRLPTMGSSQAPSFAVALFDCTCEHCRRLHPLLRAAEASFHGRVAIIVLPVPLDSECNPLIQETQVENLGACDYARLDLAVFLARASAFRPFDDFLFSPSGLPSLEDARAKAVSLVGEPALESALANSWVRRQLETDVRLYIANSQALRNARLPQLIFADAAFAGEVPNTEDLKRLIAEHRLFTRPSAIPTGLEPLGASSRGRP